MIVGTAGHIDHGKTTLVKALTGTDADRLKEEKQRGITIDLGFAYARFADDAITGFIDVPGHERFIHTMLAGAGGIDYALLVVAADDGIKPQTLEHLAILDLLGVSRGLVCITKADLADPARLQTLSAEIHALLAPTSLKDVEILPVSAATGDGIDALKTRLADAERATTAASADGRFRLSVDRSFTLSGAGTVVTGTVLSGSVAVGDRVTVSPSGLSARIRSIHAQNQQTERGFAGQRCALNLAGESISKDAVGRGDMVLDPVLHAPTTRIDVELSVLDSEPKPLGDWFSARFHHASAETGARIVPLEGPVAPGSRGKVQLVLDQPIAATVGDRFILRDVSAQRTIGGGRLIDLRAPLRKRRTPERLGLLDAAAHPDAGRALRAMLDTAPFLVDLQAFAQDRALSEAQLQAAIRFADAEMVESPSGRHALSRENRQRFSSEVHNLLETFHADNPDLQGMGRERLRLQVTPRLPAPAFLTALRAEQAAGTVALEGAFARLPGHEVRLNAQEEALYNQILPFLQGENRFRPLRVRDFAEQLGVDEREIRRVLKLCARLGRLDQIRHDHFFTRQTTAEMVAIIRDVAAKTQRGEFTAALFRDRVNNGRKVAIEILEFFDRQGVTIRRGDLRRINPHRLDLYDAASESTAGALSVKD
ncbi:selenocysteine-specific translation elongation factor [Tianweitania sp. BSSL-BM11]|uniref:Selenocysteine-specific elongation factor n=1 Tax=Tianweitania aestuarii TaxID=2814886 RepID=A0ABS5RRM6_9HYPH|nr:selenocysteine-specific translation elongation factor [Tianweitania aestuarii]MBS9719617.1 selenocysteine-specific translation elongation factor [Tianweitania aestuarii]